MTDDKIDQLTSVARGTASYRVRRALERATAAARELVELQQRHGIDRAIEIGRTDDDKPTTPESEQ